MQFINNLLTTINDHLAIILTGLGLLLGIIEKSRKLPFNPVSKIFKWLRNNMKDEELYKKVDNIAKVQEKTNQDLLELQRSKDYDVMESLRFRILDFERVLRNRKKTDVFSKEQFDAIFDMETKYEHLVEKYKIDNNKFVKAKEYINKRYEELYG